MRISDWSSDVCSSDLLERISQGAEDGDREIPLAGLDLGQVALADAQVPGQVRLLQATVLAPGPDGVRTVADRVHDLRRQGLFLTGRRLSSPRPRPLSRPAHDPLLPGRHGTPHPPPPSLPL